MKKQKQLRKSPEDLKKKKIKMSTDAIRSCINPLGGLDVNVQDQVSDIVDYYLCRHLFDLALSSSAVIDTYNIDVVDASSIITGTYICIQEGKRAFQAQVVSIATNTITLDTPIDYGFTTAASIANRSPDLNVDGSVTPVIAELYPVSGVKWDIVRVIFSMVHASAADDGKFGGIDALTNGIVLRKSDTIHHTIFNAKTNGQLRERMYDIEFSDRAPAGEYGTSARRTFGGQSKNGVVIRLDGNLDDSIQLIIQDDLTDLTSFRVVAQGHVVEGY